MKNPPVILIAGPTGVGKSAVAMAYAKLAAVNSVEIVACDAIQVYREVAIASDKPSSEMRRRVPHHVLDVVSVVEEFNAARYRVLASAAIDDILARGKQPVIVGGSGMYMMALLDGLFEEGGAADSLRTTLEGRELSGLYAELQRVDPPAAAKISSNDRMRIVRALEVFHTTGVPMSVQQRKRAGIWGKYDIRLIGLERLRAELYCRVEARVDAMFAAGLVDEVKGLLDRPLSATAARIIGVPEIKGALGGEYDLERARYLIKMHTRHYVKRQMTWFRKEKRLQWLVPGPNETAPETAQRIKDMI